MKFKIRYADQIVGFFVVLSLLALVFVIVMLGRSQRWFAKDLSYTTILPSAGGLGKNMAVQYRGFTIGNVKSFQLTEDDEVEVIFVINEEYTNRVKLGSMVEVMQSPIGLGNQFLFHAGMGAPLEEGSFVPTVGSAQARELIRQGLAEEPRHDDSISLLMNRASAILGELEEALGVGSEYTQIGQIVGSIKTTLTEAETLPASVETAIEELKAELLPLLASLNTISEGLTGPDGFLDTVLDIDGEVYQNLVKSLGHISSSLESLDKTLAFVPGQLPQLAGLIMELRVSIRSAEEVLVALTNNPLLRGGVPARPESQGSGTGPRDLNF